ncbi:hypothetical protein D477_003018 [Arthrobacter crystallopoietes BAB-32]|uniref:Uncharacterized protein n=1 Tax=Arthrobacter crystallopoietes BAB-32 TaxID=1246476 RepID=N1V6A0_9MICC|nr:hypothetical protein D477_003018 [Arthrobacter crystallopoietes BAB-32]
MFLSVVLASSQSSCQSSGMMTGLRSWMCPRVSVAEVVRIVQVASHLSSWSSGRAGSGQNS